MTETQRTEPDFRTGAEFGRGRLSGTVMIIGFGDLAQKLTMLLLQQGYVKRIVAVGRDEESLIRDVNLCRYTAANARSATEIVAYACDATDTERLSDCIVTTNPDIIVNSTTVQSWRRLTELPQGVFDSLDEAQFGPWLPMHLAPALAVYDAYLASGSQAVLVNCGFPDAVNPILAAVHGSCRALGAGNASNLIPALRFACARLWEIDPRQVEILLAAQHYVSHRVPRYGDSGGAPMLLGAFVSCCEYRSVEGDDLLTVLHDVATTGRRRGGINGQFLTASSVLSVVAASFSDSSRIVHSPGVGGLPGGYPIEMDKKGWRMRVHPGHIVQELVDVNRRGQEFDGIVDIDSSTGIATLAAANLERVRHHMDYPWGDISPSRAWQISKSLRGSFVDLLKTSNKTVSDH
ncbi:hypothetical protein ACN9MI_19740 [Rhodococcoides fascians]|uniref:hypothetical protein n=1 Tax=Rhodococcoides fascians TaxID=1828 RepID=UPI003CEFBCC5